jgi:hypothetical protein
MSENGLIDRDVVLFNHRENTPKLAIAAAPKRIAGLIKRWMNVNG